MAYTPTVWKNGEFPPIDAEHLNKIEQGIANSAPGGFGYGEYEGFKSWDDNDGSKLESYLDSLLDGTDKIIRFTGLADYPSNILSGNSGWADVAFQNNGCVCVEWCGPTYITAGTSIGMQKAYKKRLVDGTWLPWEYANPPMELGTEYRTTERYLGKPVYTKMVNCGNLPNGTTVEVAHGIANIGFIVAAQAIASTNNTVFNGRAYLPGISNESLTDRWTTYLAGVTNQNISIYCGGGLAGCPVYVTLKYTKTTD